MMSETTAAPSRWERLTAKYREDHQHPVNHILHVGVGWPMVGASLFLLPFRPLWSLGLFLGGYAIMFFGHFAIEKNVPTILKDPTTPFVMAWSVTRGILRKLGLQGRAPSAPQSDSNARA